MKNEGRALDAPVVPRATPPLPDPDVEPQLAADHGDLPPGRYGYAYAWWRGTRAQCTGPSPVAELDLPDGGGVAVTLPDPPAGADGFLLHRRIDGGHLVNLELT